MTTINNLPILSSLNGSDKIGIYDNNNGYTSQASLALLNQWIQSQATNTVPQYVTQYSAPSATGFNVQITDNSENTHLILTPVAGYATGAITLPAVSNAVDKQLVLVNTTQAVTTFTVNANGASAVTGEPSTLSANDFFTLKYDAITQTWYRVG